MMKPFELYITHLSWVDDGKNRPVLVYVPNGDDIGVYQITTQYSNKSVQIRSKYFEIKDWDKAGLNKPSYIDTGTLIEISAALLAGRTPIGKLTEADKQRFIEFLS